MKRALVISGGGSKGAFAIGIIKRLFNQFPNLEFDMFVGTSTGSLIVPLVAMKEMDLLEMIYTTQRTQDIVLKNRLGDRLNDHSIFDASPLWKLLETHYTDERYKNVLQTGKNLFLTTTCLQSGELVVFTTDPAPAEVINYEVRSLIDANHFRKAVMASACQPVFMPPIKVNKDVPGEPDPGFQFVDGGVREYAGVEMAIDNGATEIFTILLSPDTKAIDHKELTDLFSILQKTIDIFTEDVGKNDLIIPDQINQALIYIEAVKRKMKGKGLSDEVIKDFFTIAGLESPLEGKMPIKFFTFRPEASLGGGPGGLTFDPAEMKGMVQKGQQSANNFIASLNPSDITWA
ncbi:MAG: patatin-like phospholipase family protein [Ferruginibacter sp.]